MKHVFDGTSLNANLEGEVFLKLKKALPLLNEFEALKNTYSVEEFGKIRARIIDELDQTLRNKNHDRFALFAAQELLGKASVIEARTLFPPKKESENHADVDDIADKIKLVMGADCEVVFQYVDDIAPSGSGKYLYTKSNVAAV
jgi:hypothetical protein